MKDTFKKDTTIIRPGVVLEKEIILLIFFISYQK